MEIKCRVLDAGDAMWVWGFTRHIGSLLAQLGIDERSVDGPFVARLADESIIAVAYMKDGTAFRVIGMGKLVHNVPRDCRCYIDYVLTDPEYWGSGLEREIAAFLLDEAAQRNLEFDLDRTEQSCEGRGL